MENIKIGFKTFEIIEEIKENTYKAKRKNKLYYVRIFPNDANSCLNYLESHKKFNNTGVKHPKVVALDKKKLIVISEFIDGPTVQELLIKSDLDEKIYEKIFLMTYLARANREALNYDPELYRFDGEELYYMGTDLYPYKDELKFVDKGIKLWFYTKEFNQLITEKGLAGNKDRIKQDFAINKEIVLMTCKYYH